MDNTLRRFVNEVQAIRNVSGNDFANKVIQKAYYEVDQPFRDWLRSLKVNEDKDERIQEWRLTHSGVALNASGSD